MEHLRFCGSLNIACGYAGEQGFCTLSRPCGGTRGQQGRRAGRTDTAMREAT